MALVETMGSEETKVVGTEEKPEKQPPKSGQSGGPLDLPLAKINAKEKKIVDMLNEAGRGATASLAELAANCFSDTPGKQANSWVRNSLRRLVRGGWAEKADRGSYRITDEGIKRLSE